MSGFVTNDVKTSGSDEAKLWLPPEKVWRYEWFKVGAGGLVCVMFAGWLVLQWSNPVMRWVSVALIGTTCWVVVGTLLDDLRRGRGRQVILDHGSLRVDGPNGRQEIRLDEVAFASWRDDDQAGLWFYDKQHRATVYLDGEFLADQSEARAFLGWLRGSERLSFEVRWPVGDV